MKNSRIPCKPGKHERSTKRKRQSVIYESRKGNKFHMLIDTCGICGMWRWAVEYLGGAARGSFSRFLPAEDRPVPKRARKVRKAA